MRARLWKMGVLALILAGTVVGSSAQNVFTPIEYWDVTNGTASSTIFTGISGNLAIGNYNNIDGDHGFIYNTQNQSNPFSAPVINASATSTYFYGISGGRIAGTYSADNQSYGFIYNTAAPIDQRLITLDAGTEAFGISGNRVVFSSASGQYGIYDLTNSSISNLTISRFDDNDYNVKGITGNTVYGYYLDSTIGTGGAYRGFLYDCLTDSITSFDATPAEGTGVLNTTYIYGLTEDGKVIGTYYASDSPSLPISFVYDISEGNQEDINDPDSSSTELYGKDGQTLVGTVKRDNKTMGVLVVPEPTTYALIALGLFVMAISRCKSRRSPQA